jgi:hypothetical protein
LTDAAARSTLRPHARDVMILQVPSLCCSAHVRHIPVSLPRIDALIADQPAKYALPTPTGPDVPPQQVRGRGRMSHDDANFIEKRLA